MKFKEGDKVRVRTWEDMEREFGLNEFGDINTPASFTPNMRKYCGKIFIIEYCNDGSQTYYLHLGDSSRFLFSDENLESITAPCKNDGEIAFPESDARGKVASGEGMTLRDYFAGQALIAILTRHSDNDSAKRCYLIADAMMKAREQ